MTGPDPNPETGGRPLAEILREAGIDMSRQARRRRWNDPEWDDPVPQRRANHETDPGTRAAFGRRRGDRPESDGRGREAVRPRPGEPQTAAIPNMRASHKPEVPEATGPVGRRPEAERRREPESFRAERFPAAERPRDAERVRDLDRGREPERRRDSTRDRAPERLSDSGRLRPAERSVEREPPASGRSGGRGPKRAEPRDEHPSTGPIPIATDLDDEEVGGRENAMAWLRFVGELVIALAAGVGVYFAFTVLWEMLPYVAVIAAPAVVAGLVAGVGMWRSRAGREAVGGRLLVVLVFAGTLLTIAPAAGLLSGS